VSREIALEHGRKRFDEGPIVTLPDKNLLPVIAPGHDVMSNPLT
jgi:hypothetical protein